ncbi:MAG: TRAP transporter small permease, partial [Dermabacteraceae bacterium]
MQLLTKGLNRSLGVATALLFTIMVLAVVWQVFTREVIQSPAAWTEELAKYVFVWTSLVGAALVFSERGHIAVTFLVERLPRPVRMSVAVLIQLVILVFALAILVYGGLLAAQNSWSQQLTALPGTIGQAYLILPVSGALIALIAVLHIVEDLRGIGPLTATVVRTEE